MAPFATSACLLPALAAILMVLLALPVKGQFNTPCTASMVSSFSPCMNFTTNSTANGTVSSPTADCCSALRSVTSNGTDCFCLILAGRIPFQIPINRTLAISLPRACNMPGVPLQCKASAAPLPAPGPISPGLAPSPGAAPSPSPTASSVPVSNSSPTLAPESDTPPALTPTSPTVESGAPTEGTGSRPTATPSAAHPSFAMSPFLVLLVLGLSVLMYC